MTSIHYFPRYTQKENVVTNNAMLFLSRISSHKPELLQELIHNCIPSEEDRIVVGVDFSQQVRGPKRIADGVISQSSFEILVETKLYENFDANQLAGHLEHFIKNDSKNSVLLSLAPTRPDVGFIENFNREVAAFNQRSERTVRFRCLTFQKLVSVFRSLISDQDDDMKNLADEFEAYCRSEDLIPRHRHTMRAVLCGSSLEFNLKEGVYFHSSDRGYSHHGFVGCYDRKAIRGVGKLDGIVRADLNQETGEFDRQESLPSYPGKSPLDLTEEVLNKIRTAIDYAKKAHDWDISTGFTFFIVDNFVETEFKKESSGPLRGTKNFDLEEVLEHYSYDDAIEDIAVALGNVTWD